MLNGREAQDLWRRFERNSPGAARRYEGLSTYHSSRQAFIGTREVREARLSQLRQTFASAAELLAADPN